MLDRRHIRTKVLQTLHAFEGSEKKDTAAGEKELLFSLDRFYDLYLLFLLLYREVYHAAGKRIEQRKHKNRPSDTELNPNTRFIDNPILKALVEHHDLTKKAKDRGLDWGDHPELGMRIFRDLEAGEPYRDYLEESAQTGGEGELKILIAVLRDHIASSENLHYILEEKSIYWMDDIDVVCQGIIRTLRNLHKNPSPKIPLLPIYKDKSDQDFASRLLRKTMQNQAQDRDLIARYTTNWESDRIALMDRQLLQLAITEARAFSDIPVKVTINEYIEIAKAYSTEKSHEFINGILERILTDLQESGEVKKAGKGLL